jgi:quercetin 2,3-dioxygenase
MFFRFFEMQYLTFFRYFRKNQNLIPTAMATNILSVQPIDFQWPVANPFIFCAHHLDYYPFGKPDMSPNAPLTGRNIGSDFTIKDGWRMYHGDTVPGFPVHPHRGFETITIVQQGFVDHSDSHGQAGRYGQGDVQWMTAGAGLQHSEMFPLINQDAGNTCELFQVWLNLPASRKFAEPYFKMLWSEDIPVYRSGDGKVEANIIAGTLEGIQALPPAPDSWAAFPENDVAIWTIQLQPGAVWTLPAAGPKAVRTLYFHRGFSIQVEGTTVAVKNAIRLKADAKVLIESPDTENRILLLQGNPIEEPVVQYGPFVMNTQQEIRQAYYDYQQTEFGGWPWPRKDQTHGLTRGRFARHRDGTEEER